MGSNIFSSFSNNATSPSEGPSVFLIVGLIGANCLPFAFVILSTDIFLPLLTEAVEHVLRATMEGNVGWMSGFLRLKVPAHFSVVGSGCFARSPGVSLNEFACVGLTTKNQLILLTTKIVNSIIKFRV